MPESLYLTGDATASSWTNTPPDAQKFTTISNGVFEITAPLQAGKFFKFLGRFGEWAPQFGEALLQAATWVRITVVETILLLFLYKLQEIIRLM
jgi:hypothetical protein